jgi:hypothetical protein
LVAAAEREERVDHSRGGTVECARLYGQGLGLWRMASAWELQPRQRGQAGIGRQRRKGSRAVCNDHNDDDLAAPAALGSLYRVRIAAPPASTAYVRMPNTQGGRPNSAAIGSSATCCGSAGRGREDGGLSHECGGCVVLVYGLGLEGVCDWQWRGSSQAHEQLLLLLLLFAAMGQLLQG